MKIPSAAIPQADNLDDVIKTVATVAKGGKTFQEIAHAIGKHERQGRYYRKAAEILGFIEKVGRNNFTTTPLGQEFLNLEKTERNSLLITSVLNARIFQRLIPFFEANKVNGVTRQEVYGFLLQVSEIKENDKDSMAPRRLSSVISWLEKLKIIIKLKNRYYLSTENINQKVNILEFIEIDEPILPKSNDLREYETVNLRTSKAREDIIIYQNSAAVDRADNAHRKLVNLVADRIKKSGSIPRYNKFIDLATKNDDKDFIFEMKSITDSNAKSQVRSGLSQLYEYRYLQNLPDAKLILVIEKPLPKKNNWMVEYLEKDRNIFLLWDGDNNLYGSNHSKNTLKFLNIA